MLGLLKRTFEHRGTDLWKRLLNLTSLSMRRTRGDLIQKYKLENNLEVINWHNKPLSISARANHRVKYHRELVRNCSQRHNFFNNRIANAWNALPNNVTDSKSVISFKKNLDKHYEQFLLNCLTR